VRSGQATPTNPLAARLGARIRRARFAVRKTQRAVATGAGVSQSTVGRIELGRGGHVPLDTWERVAAVVGLDLSAVIRTPSRVRSHTLQMRCHRMVSDLAGRGGWATWTISTPDDPAQTETILERPERREVAIVRVWDVLGNVEAEIAAFKERLAEERTARGEGCRVGGVVVVTAGGENRRRLSETGAPVARAFSLHADDWLMALGRFRVPMPDELGMIWTDERVERLRPILPYVDFRLRHRGQGRSRSTA
jgi:transcriptional regulator with XRE-family HTH domain